MMRSIPVDGSDRKLISYDDEVILQVFFFDIFFIDLYSNELDPFKWGSIFPGYKISLVPGAFWWWIEKYPLLGLLYDENVCILLLLFLIVIEDSRSNQRRDRVGMNMRWFISTRWDWIEFWKDSDFSKQLHLLNISGTILNVFCNRSF